MKTLNKGQLVYLKQLYQADLKSASANNDTNTLDAMQSIIDDAKNLSFSDEILYTRKVRKQYPEDAKGIKKKRRYVIEVTQAEMDSLCGNINIARDGMWDYDKTKFKHLTKILVNLCEVRENGMKSVKYYL